jgi:hypothetical protein
VSYLDRIATCRRWDPDAYRPFVVAGRAMGRVRAAFARRLADFAPVFHVEASAVILSDRLADFDSRSAAVAEVLARLREAGDLENWRGEDYPVVSRWGDEPLMKMERGAVPDFGVRSVGVHLNGFVETPEGARLWVARRALDKPIAPGKLDHIVAGGQPHGLAIRDNLVKECAEEADIPADLAATARPVGLVSYICERPEGLRDDVLFVYDLDVPAAFRPVNTDGEVAEFFLWPLERVAEVIRETEDFKFNCALVNIDFFLRRGFIAPDEPDYQAIAEGLRRPPDSIGKTR